MLVMCVSFSLWYCPRTFSRIRSRRRRRRTNYKLTPENGKISEPGSHSIRSEEPSSERAPMRQSINADGSNLIECDEWVFPNEFVFGGKRPNLLQNRLSASWLVFVCLLHYLSCVYSNWSRSGFWFGARHLVCVSIWFKHWISRDNNILKLSSIFLCYRCLRMTQIA